MPETASPTRHDSLFSYGAYGGWSVQRPGHGCLGRFDPFATRSQPDGRTFELDLRLDRAAYALYREAGLTHKDALHNALLCGSWAGHLNVGGAGVWELDACIPASPHVEYVVMLWPHDDAMSPRGEINIIEGRATTATTMVNVHWADDSGEARHDPLHIDLDVTSWHRYRVEIAEAAVRWYVDDALVREAHCPHAPHDIPLHIAVQCGVNPSILDAWHPEFEFHERIYFRPVSAPGL